MKKKLRLDTVLKIKDKLEEIIFATQKDIVRYNTSEIKIDKLLNKLKSLEKQFVILKTTVQKANTLEHEDGKPNFDYIFELSNLKNFRTLLYKLNGNESTSQLDNKEITKRTKQIGAAQDIIRTKMENFNTSHFVTVELDESLNLLNE